MPPEIKPQEKEKQESQAQMSPKEVKIRQLARIAHEGCRAYAEMLGDKHQLPWDKLPKEQKDHAVAGVTHCLQFVNIHNIGNIAPHVHDAWRERKKLAGWKRIGKESEKPTGNEKTNVEAKEHALLVPFKYLKDEDRKRNFLFCSFVLGAAPHFGVLN